MTDPSPFTSAQLSKFENIVRGVYRGLLGRDPEPAGLAYWSRAIADNGDAGVVLNAIIQTDEFKKHSAEKATQAGIKAALAKHAQTLLAKRPLTIVDVGAQELENEQHIYAAIAEHNIPYQIIGFEPQEEKIKESNQRNPDARIRLFPTFIGDGGSHTFHINNDDATSSLLPLNHALIKDLVYLSPLATVRTENVRTSTLDDVLTDCPHIDFLKLDIQGFELAALQHAEAVLRRTNVIHCEVSFAEIYQGQSLFSEIETHLRSHGFYFLDFSSTCHYAYHGASNSVSRDRLGWGDAVFFKRAELLASEQDLLAQLVIAMLIYEKFSFAEFLAQAYDAISKANLSSIFSEHLP